MIALTIAAPGAGAAHVHGVHDAGELVSHGPKLVERNAALTTSDSCGAALHGLHQQPSGRAVISRTRERDDGVAINIHPP